MAENDDTSEYTVKQIKFPKCKLPDVDEQHLRRIREKAFEDGLKLGSMFYTCFNEYSSRQLHDLAFFYSWICLYYDERMRDKVEKRLLPLAQSKLEPDSMKEQGVDMEFIDSMLKHAIEDFVDGD